MSDRKDQAELLPQQRLANAMAQDDLKTSREILPNLDKEGCRSLLSILRDANTAHENEDFNLEVEYNREFLHVLMKCSGRKYLRGQVIPVEIKEGDHLQQVLLDAKLVTEDEYEHAQNSGLLTVDGQTRWCMSPLVLPLTVPMPGQESWVTVRVGLRTPFLLRVTRKSS